VSGSEERLLEWRRRILPTHDAEHEDTAGLDGHNAQ
jgi:hypothetical protein